MLKNFILSAIAIAISARLMGDLITVGGPVDIALIIIVCAMINNFVRPVLRLLTLPINIFTLGVFGIFLNGLLIKLAAYIVPGFEVSGIFSAIFFGFLYSIIYSLLYSVFRSEEKK